MVIAHDDGLAVALGVEGIAGGTELFAKFYVVIDFAVEGKGIALGVVLGAPAERLIGVLEVDDG